MSLYEQMLNILNNESGIAWDYYDDRPNTVNPIENPLDSWEFIKWYFNNGQKKSVLDISLDSVGKVRSIHTVSTFFIGLLICHWLYNGKELAFAHDEVKLPFRYLWFLASLFHDIGYVVEDDKGQFPLASGLSSKISYPAKNGYRQLAKVREKLNMNCTIYTGITKIKLDEECRRNKCGGGGRNDLSVCRIKTTNEYMKNRNRYISVNSETSILGYRYSSEEMAKYFWYCLGPAVGSFNNHGIVGGHLFFDRMIKNYVDSYHSACREGNTNISFDNFEYGTPKRFFKKEQFSIFAYIADCIIAHNVWVAKEEDRDIYIKYELDFLLPENFRKISFEENPVLYILAIADTIEPCKCYCSNESKKFVQKVWRGIDIGYEKEHKTINITVRDEDIDAEPLISKVKDLSNWVNVEVICEDRTIKIRQLAK